jgi:hypothetical protein
LDQIPEIIAQLLRRLRKGGYYARVDLRQICASSLSIPSDCEPWPGNINPSAILPLFHPHFIFL